MQMIFLHLKIFIFFAVCIFAYEFDDYDDNSPYLNCNWAQAFSDIDTLFGDVEMQEALMMLASHWEGRFAVDGIGINFARGITLSVRNVDYETGNPITEVDLPGPDCDSGISMIYKTGCQKIFFKKKDDVYLDVLDESFHTMILAMALNESPHAVEFVRSSMPVSFNGSVSDFIIDQLRKKINIYEYYNSRYPGFGGVPTQISFDENETPIAFETQLNFTSIGKLVWPAIAVYQVLQRVPNDREWTALAQQYKTYIDRIAKNILLIFLTRDSESLLNVVINVVNPTAEPTDSNYEPDIHYGAISYLYEEAMSVMFVYLYADWTAFGGEEARKKMWDNFPKNAHRIEYRIGLETIYVEQGFVFASGERLRYLMLPYLDVPIDEQVFRNGEIARTHQSVTNRVAGLYSSTYNYALLASKSDYVICGVKLLAKYPDQIEADDVIAPYASYPLLLHKDLRKFGLAWYIAMLRGSRMQGPYGAMIAGQANGTLITPKLEWYEKVAPIVAFDGGIVSIIREYLNSTEKYDEFYEMVQIQRLSLFGNETLLNPRHNEVFLPTVMLDDSGERFKACSDRKFTWKKKTQPGKKSSLIALVCLPFIALFMIILFIRMRKKKSTFLWTSTSSDLPIHSRTKTDRWEIELSALTFDEVRIGAGAFANVFKGMLKQQPAAYKHQRFAKDLEAKETIVVAVKIPILSNKDSVIDDFNTEINFMKNLGYHTHLVNMIGCVSNQQQPMLLLEYCALGDLLRFVRRVKQRIVESLISRILNGTKFQKNGSDELTGNDLISIAWQVNDAMVYLSSRNHIHRDLAARNVLLTDGMVAKIGDFGLCRTADSEHYTSRGGMLPYKWMAPESLQSMEFSFQSDVWSYGVLLYELYSLGDVPYETIQKMEILKFLKDGQRLEQPQFADEKIYSLMTQCWSYDPKERPTFEKINQILVYEMEQNSESYGYLLIDRVKESHSVYSHF